MRLLIAPPAPARPGTAPAAPDALTDDDLDRLYGHDGPLLRTNFATTLDGSATGADGVSGSINTDADHRGFAAMRRAADVLLVGAGTARAEGYRDDGPPMVVVSRRGELPELLAGSDRVVLATCASSGHDDGDSTWVCGDEDVDLAEIVRRCQGRVGPHVLCEGGPSLATDLLAAGLVDQVALSWVPRLVGGAQGEHPRMLQGPSLDLGADPVHLLEEDGTLLGLWQVRAGS